MQKHNRFHQNRYTTSVLVFVLIAAASAVVVLKHNRTDAAPAVKPKNAAVKSMFSFAGTPGWWQGATNKTPMALFHQVEDGCFTSMEYKTGTVDADAELQKTETSLTGDGYTVTPSGTQTLTLQTTTGPQQYELHQSSVTTPTGTSKLMGGQEFGYIQLASGYLKIMGYCDTADQLPATIPALEVYKFDVAD